MNAKDEIHLDEIRSIAKTLETLNFSWMNAVAIDNAAKKLSAYMNLLIETNKSVNLISRQHSEFDIVLKEHIYDSLLGVPYILGVPGILKDALPGTRTRAQVADIGSGAGLPGIPLACVAPELGIDLIESTRKRSDFLRLVCEKLSLHHVRVIEQNSAEVRQTYTCLTARAFGSIQKIYQLSRHLLKKDHVPHGTYMLYKGKRERVDSELREWRAGLPASMDPKVQCHPLNHSGKERFIVEIHLRGKRK